MTRWIVGTLRAQLHGVGLARIVETLQRGATESMDLYDVMRTTFAARDLSNEPVDDATLYRILDNARFAPSGGNRQGWRVIVVRDRAKRLALADLIRPTMQRYLAQVAAGESPWNTVVPTKVDEAAIA